MIWYMIQWWWWDYMAFFRSHDSRVTVQYRIIEPKLCQASVVDKYLAKLILERKSHLSLKFMSLLKGNAFARLLGCFSTLCSPCQKCWKCSRPLCVQFFLPLVRNIVWGNRGKLWSQLLPRLCFLIICLTVLQRSPRFSLLLHWTKPKKTVRKALSICCQTVRPPVRLNEFLNCNLHTQSFQMLFKNKLVNFRAWYKELVTSRQFCPSIWQGFVVTSSRIWKWRFCLAKILPALPLIFHSLCQYSSPCAANCRHSQWGVLFLLVPDIWLLYFIYCGPAAFSVEIVIEL